ENYFSTFKQMFGSSLRSRCWRSQQSELFMKVLLHNIKVIL
ncbi:IS5/IS1182 family transposase, partial [Candidatus Micrarchaeota archaeon]|nr:IS5/IS1182 family transposase [Candidatus Micrarchaeota archaeon]MBI5225208.1 IS5/IS1182 family transposase [Candidatus Micrarchaeota archaeon]MBI5225458.1 IS5/IS1182 family transposase [Candidatus Micrarchaeota archaeon]MBI5225476.1 IS5/IS1182 family transposase [Candidatus Micrarchaeota archaeon]